MSAITISKKIKKQATIERIGSKFRLNENGTLRKFEGLCEAIEFCNKHKVQVSNKHSLSTFFLNKLIH